MIDSISTKKTIFLILSFIIFSNNIFSQTGMFLPNFKEGKKEYYKGNYELAIELFKSNSDASVIYSSDAALIQIWLAKAYYKLSRSNYNIVIDYLNSSIKNDNSYSDAFYLRARINQFEGVNYPYMVKDYIRASELADKNQVVIKSLSEYSLGNKEEAINYLMSIVENGIEKRFNETNYAFSVIYANEGDLELALEKLELALDNGFADTDFLMIDFYEYRNNNTFLTFIDEYGLSETFYQSKYEDEIKKYVERKVNSWQTKGKYEKTSDYLERVNEIKREEKITYYTESAIDSIATSLVDWNVLENQYDADNETFKLVINGVNPIYLFVPINEAPSFGEGFQYLEFSEIGFDYLGRDEFELVHLEITNPQNGITYVYEGKDIPIFNSSKFDFNFEEMEIVLDTKESLSNNVAKETTKTISVGKSDVDSNIPVTNLKNNNTYALIIGNEDYTKYQTNLSSESNVDYARKDAEIFAEYCEKTLGIPKENITLIQDAISSQMQRAIEKISKIAMYHGGEANIIFYYAGHGFPDEITKESYLMPVDVSGSDVKYGVKLNYLYEQLTQYPSQKVLVILDACFSGGGRNQGLLAARGVKIKPKENAINGNLVVFSSSSGEQSSLPYVNKQHGMFTYFLLKKLKESKGEITLEELSDYVTKEVQINALKINSKEQNPNVLVSPDVGNLWMDWKLN